MIDFVSRELLLQAAGLKGADIEAEAREALAEIRQAKKNQNGHQPSPEPPSPSLPATNGNGHSLGPLTATSGPTVEERAIAYLAEVPPAISGQKGHNQTLSAARAVVYGFDLGVERGLSLLLRHYNPRCQPPWTDAELRHKAEEADSLAFDKPRGWLLTEGKLGSPGGTPGAAPGTPQGHQPLDPDEVLVVRASEITPRQLDWLWPDVIALGKLTTFAGQGGLGKTFCLLDIAARLSTGRSWPGTDGQTFDPGQVLFISGEDEPDDTLVPRLIELQARLDRITFLTPAAQDRFTLADLPMLEQAIHQTGQQVRLVVVDPPTAYLAGVDDHKNAELRALLSPLKNLAARHRLALIFNTHINKAARLDAMHRVMGSVAWVNAVRAAHLFVRDPDDDTRRLFLPMKQNLGPERKGLAYRIVKTDALARVEWLGEVTTSADQAVNHLPSRPRKVVAAEWLIEAFRRQREWKSDDLFRAAREEGISRGAIYEAKNRLDLPKARKETDQAGDVFWVWWVPDDWSHLSRNSSSDL